MSGAGSAGAPADRPAGSDGPEHGGGSGSDVSTRLRAALWPPEATAPRSRLHEAWLVVQFTVRRWIVVDRAGTVASALTLQTLLSVVPLAAVALLVVRQLDPAYGLAALTAVARQITPDDGQTEALVAKALAMGEQLQLERLGLIGLLSTIAVAYWLFSTFERACNEIWRAERRRSPLANFTMFYTVATLAPGLILYSVAGPLLGQLARGWVVAQWTASWIALLLAIRIIPDTTVHWRSAALGAAVAATLFESGKLAFSVYVVQVAASTYEYVYGSLAVLPVFVLWAHLSWMIVLLGLQVAWVAQHASSVARMGWVPQVPGQGARAGDERAAARILLAIADRYERHGSPSDLEALAGRFKLERSHVRDLLTALERARLIVRTQRPEGWVPARPLEKIHVAEVLALFPRDLSMARDDALARLFAELDAQATARLAGLDLRALVTSERNPVPRLDPRARAAVSGAFASADLAQPADEGEGQGGVDPAASPSGPRPGRSIEG